MNITSGTTVAPAVDVVTDRDGTISYTNIECDAIYTPNSTIKGSLVTVTEYKAREDIVIEKISLATGARTTIAKINTRYR